MTTVREIVAKHLVEQKLDGLFNADGDCACDLRDLMPCEDWVADCQPGTRTPCPAECGEHDFHIVLAPGEVTSP